MNRVLVITYLFPPSKKVGALRSRGIARYLPEMGWEPVFIVPVLPGQPPSGFNITETHPPYRKMLRFYFDGKKRKRLREMHLPLPPFHERLLSFIRGSFDYPDNMAGWIPFARSAAEEAIRRYDIRHMLTISGPMTCHMTGRLLKEQFPHIFWLADYRDPWTLYGESTPFKRAERNLEINTVAGADAISIVSNLWAQDYMKMLPGKRVYFIPNAFDPDELNDGKTGLTDEFTISHTGELYPDMMSPEPLFAALAELSREKRVGQFSFRFYGEKQKWLLPLAKKYGIEEFVSYHGTIERSRILNIQRESQILFIPGIGYRNGRGRLTAKIYEYLAAMRPIIYTGDEETEIARLLAETRAGHTCSSLEAAKTVLAGFYNEWKQNGSVMYASNKDLILKHSHREMANKFSEILKCR